MHYFWFGLENLSGSNSSLGQRLLMAYPANHLLLDMLKTEAQAPCRFYLPACCRTPDLDNLKEVFFYPAESPVEPIQRTEEDYLLLSNGAVFAKVDETYLREVLSSFDWEAAAFRIDPSLDAGREQARLTRDSRIVGFRRQYRPAAEPDFPSEQQPDFLYCRPEVLERLLCSLLERPGLSFPEHCESIGLKVSWLRIGGRRLDLFSEAGLAALLRFSQTHRAETMMNPALWKGRAFVRGIVHGGRELQIGSGAVIAAPAILCDRARIGEGAVVQGVFLGPSVSVPSRQRIQGQGIWNGEGKDLLVQTLQAGPEGLNKDEKPFREWSYFSYPRFGKRLVDVLISIIVLLLFLPFFPLIALAVKLTSPGPVFYRARRQGLHGREFSCLKFRTMIVGAETLQEQLRTANQVDGPQFKIEDDPRTSPIGKFLRDTCIDELPQFVNVLLGQMSVVGPRPSPENENEYCPAWRQARLSVRPGITGLWQVCRTRQPGRDFQEWIYYDMEYVRRLSLGLDLLICLKTARKLIGSFLDQFG
ncbi:MAG TPA: sugar transferase [Anaerohalosphaeraceae bacterium]|nr:sugar transferase [Anaerohalosphaeraceae bacterium]